MFSESSVIDVWKGCEHAFYDWLNNKSSSILLSINVFISMQKYWASLCCAQYCKILELEYAYGGGKKQQVNLNLWSESLEKDF